MLSGLVINFFYTGTNVMVSLFLEVFGNEVPCAAIALGATAIFFPPLSAILFTEL